MIDKFGNVFEQDVRDGEPGLPPNNNIPGLHAFLDQGPGRLRMDINKAFSKISELEASLSQSAKGAKPAASVKKQKRN